MIETSGEMDRVVMDLFTEYPNREYNDDGYLTKPGQAYDWFDFHDSCSSRMFGGNDWELTPYLSQGALACHLLFASRSYHAPERRWDDGNDDGPVGPYTGPRANHLAYEAEKENRAQLQALHAQLPPTLGRSFRSAEAMAVDLMPYLLKIVSPNVKPVVVGGSQMATATVRREGERVMVKRAAEIMAEVGLDVQRGLVETEENVVGRRPDFVYRLEP